MIKTIKKIIRTIVDYLIFKEIYYFYNNYSDQDNNKLLIIRPDALGDFILFNPILPYIKKIYKNKKITLLINNDNYEIAARTLSYGYVDEIITFNRYKFSKNIFYRRSIFIKIAKKNFFTVIYPVFSREHNGDLMVKASNAKEKIGINGDMNNISSKQKQKNNKFYTRLINIPNNIKLEINRNLYFVKQLGAQIKQLSTNIQLSNKDIFKGNQLLINNNIINKKFCVIFPGAKMDYRIWPLDNYISIIDYIRELNIIPIICGSDKDKKIANYINNSLDKKIIDLTGQTDIFTLAAILKQSLFYFGSETGIVHLAVSVNTPTICLMGGGHFGRFFPYGDLKQNKIVYNKAMKCMNDNWKCAKNLKQGESAPCIKLIKPEQAIREIKSLIRYLNQNKKK